MKLSTSCPIEGCGKPLEIMTELSLMPGETLTTYKCGHSLIVNNSIAVLETLKDESQQIDSERETYRLSSCKGDALARDYQHEAIEFVRKTNFNCLIADQMGLGKTIEAILALVSEYDNRTPCLLLVKSATIWQWIGEFKKWGDPLPFGIFLIEGSKSWIPPSFKVYICPMDTFSRIISTDDGAKKLLDFGFKCLIVDEIHSFKNASSKRTQALIQFIKKISHREIERNASFICNLCGKQWSEDIKIEVDVSVSVQNAYSYHRTHCPKCGCSFQQRTDKLIQDEREKLDRMGLIFLSGTPIKNRADEFFVPLNILAPERFPSLDRFRRNYLDQDEKGKWSRIKPYMLDEFRRVLAPFMIRRERKDVLSDLPRFQRTFTKISIEDQGMKDAYNREIDKLIEKDAEKGSDLNANDIQENLMIMRRIIGMAKVKHAADRIEEFLEDTEDDKIAIGIHHHSVRDALIYELQQRNIKPIKVDAGKDIQWNIDQWKNKPENRVAVVSQLGGGVGLNLQFCHDLLNVERQWNSADEEQLEDRFNRFGQEYPVNAEYLVVVGTIDTWFTNMVEDKRMICGDTFGINFDPTQSQETMRDMIQFAMANKL